MNSKTVRQLLAELQRTEGYEGNQRGFAALLGISQGHLSHLLNGSRTIGATVAFRLLERYPHMYDAIKRSRVPSNMQRVIERADAPEARCGEAERASGVVGGRKRPARTETAALTAPHGTAE